MEKINLKELLIKRGYEPGMATQVCDELEQLDERLQPFLQEWIADESTSTDYVAEPYSISYFREWFGMNYVAALLTMDWYLKEPQLAQKEIERGIS